MAPTITFFYGTFVHLPRTKSGGKHELEIRHGALWVSSATGRIQGCDWSVSGEEQLQALIQSQGCVLGAGGGSCEGRVAIFRAREEQNEFFFPGFIDTHIHAPQYPNSGLFGSSTLLDWLSTYTFPLESSFGDDSLTKAHAIYNQVISRTLANGTTCASYFATIHVPATNLLATLCHRRGQRALIGRVCMDNPDFCPDYYRDRSAEASLASTKETITHIHALDPSAKLIHPIITPRFAPTCSRAALASLGALAASHSPPLHIQTHISENKDEVALVHTLFPESTSYADVYDHHGLLTPRTILAHAVHLTPEEKALIGTRHAKVSHCPASNSALGSGLCPVRSLLDAGITVGLGTDVSGGYSPSILEAVRQACLVSRLLRHSAAPEAESTANDNRNVLRVEEVLYLATRGGAAVVSMPDDLGGFDPGMFFDAQLIRLGSVESAERQPAGSSCLPNETVVDVFGFESWTEKIHKWVWTGDDRNVRRVWVSGRPVHSLEDGPADEKKGLGFAQDWWPWKWAVGLGLGLGVGAVAVVSGVMKRGRF